MLEFNSDLLWTVDSATADKRRLLTIFHSAGKVENWLFVSTPAARSFLHWK